MNVVRALSCVGLIATAACADDHTPMRFVASENAIIATGEIDADTLGLFEDIVAENPNAETLVLQYVGGSVDDEANVEFARVVREMGLNTQVPSGGLVASGGTDLFLAGVDRLLEDGACVGVHSWAAEDYTATDIPRSDPEHSRYLDYYEDVGTMAAFYWFTVQAAPADGMHWMTADEAKRFRLSTNDASSLGSQTTCDDR